MADILDVIREPLSANGLSFVQLPKSKNELTTMLMHSSGEWMSETYEMTPVKTDPQSMGSVITYQRRYALGAILGLNIDDDDDGNKASKQDQEPVKSSQQQLTDEQEKLLIQAVSMLENVDSIEKVKSVWNSIPELHTNKAFIKSINMAKEKFTRKTV